jgi:hypothetical protein
MRWDIIATKVGKSQNYCRTKFHRAKGKLKDLLS